MPSPLTYSREVAFMLEICKHAGLITLVILKDWVSTERIYSETHGATCVGTLDAPYKSGFPVKYDKGPEWLYVCCQKLLYVRQWGYSVIMDRDNVRKTVLRQCYCGIIAMCVPHINMSFNMLWEHKVVPHTIMLSSMMWKHKDLMYVSHILTCCQAWGGSIEFECVSQISTCC